MFQMSKMPTKKTVETPESTFDIKWYGELIDSLTNIHNLPRKKLSNYPHQWLLSCLPPEAQTEALELPLPESWRLQDVVRVSASASTYDRVKHLKPFTGQGQVVSFPAGETGSIVEVTTTQGKFYHIYGINPHIDSKSVQ